MSDPHNKVKMQIKMQDRESCPGSQHLEALASGTEMYMLLCPMASSVFVGKGE